MNAELIRLFVGRSLSRSRVALLLGALVLLAYVSPPAAWLLRISEDPEQARHAFALQTIWSGALWLLIPITLLHAAHLPTRWRTVERGWIASRPGARTQVIGASWIGTWLGAAALTAAIFVGAELGASPAPSGVQWAHAGEVAEPGRGFIPAEGVRWTLDTEASSEAGRLARARVRLALAPGAAPTAVAQLRMTRGDAETVAETLLIARGKLEVELPLGSGPIECELTPVGDGATLLIRDPGTEVFVEANSRFSASLAIGVHVLLTLAATIALALGLGSHLGTGYAFALLVSLWLGCWLRAGDSNWLPGSTLPEILATLHEGRAPKFPTLSAWLGAIGFAACGALLAWSRARYERGRS